MPAKLNKLPKEMVDAASQRLEDGGIEILKTHPYYEECGLKIKRARKVIDKLPREEINAIDDAWGFELMIYFGVAYAAGLIDGIGTGKALAGIGRKK